MELFKPLLSPDFMPHGYCYLWDARMVWLHVISDGLIALSYYCIPVVLIYFIRKNRDIPFNRIFWMFGTFILACGTTHLMEIWNVWHGSYLLAGVIEGRHSGGIGDHCGDAHTIGSESDFDCPAGFICRKRIASWNRKSPSASGSMTASRDSAPAQGDCQDSSRRCC